MNQMKYYVDASGVYLGGWDADPPVGAIEVPTPPDHASQLWGGEAWAVAPARLSPLSRQQIAGARLQIDGLDITGIEQSSGLAMAMMLDEQTAWVFFEEEQSDTAYIVTPGEGVTKHTDHIEVSVAGLVSLAFIVERVK